MVSRKIFGLGTIVVDHQLFVDHFPVVDTKIEATESRLQVGGPAPTALVFLSRLGHDCTFAGLWGDDHFGTIIEEDLQHERVNFFPASRQQGIETGTAHVWVEQSTGSRTIVCNRVTENAKPLEELATHLPQAGVLHLDGWPAETSFRFAQSAKSNGCTVFLDTGSPKGRTDELLQFVDVVNAPRRFLTQFFQDDDIESGARRLLESGPKMVTITDGVQGAWVFTQQETNYRPAFTIVTKDSTGAGDIFSGALIHACLQQWTPERILEFASASAALKCQQQGNREALPTLAQIEQLIASNRESV
ncbi:MAG: carbohydrate kinase family protein [Planctomycetaceae bacterium]|jgi:sugar/nucleoside kinase (ribokinase family)|nr:carbohydrate kinase family protein [Planctomycetaceae bacterium]